jgi:ketosteroid isomerase-like protein
LPPSDRAVIEKAYRGFATRDLAMLRQFSHPDVEVHTVTGAMAERHEPYRGHAGLEAYLRDVGEVWDELELMPAEFHDLGPGEVLVFGRVRARRGSMILDSASAWQWRLRDGKVSSLRVFEDADEAASLLAEGGD